MWCEQCIETNTNTVPKYNVDNESMKILLLCVCSSVHSMEHLSVDTSLYISVPQFDYVCMYILLYVITLCDWVFFHP